MTLRSTASGPQLSPTLLSWGTIDQAERCTPCPPISRHTVISSLGGRAYCGGQGNGFLLSPVYTGLTIWLSNPGPACLQEVVPLWVIKTCFLRNSTVWPKSQRYRGSSTSKALRQTRSSALLYAHVTPSELSHTESALTEPPNASPATGQR